MSDLISRNPLVDMLQGVEDNIFAEATREFNPAKAFIAGVLQEVKNQVIALPGVDAVPVVHGRWIWHEDKWKHECSNCHCGFYYDKTYLLFDHGYEYARYCPNCGAKMDGGAERDQSTK